MNDKLKQYGLLVIRILIGLAFFGAGAAKLSGVAGEASMGSRIVGLHYDRSSFCPSTYLRSGSCSSHHFGFAVCLGSLQLS